MGRARDLEATELLGRQRETFEIDHERRTLQGREVGLQHRPRRVRPHVAQHMHMPRAERVPVAYKRSNQIP